MKAYVPCMLILLGMKNVVEKIKTHTLCSITFFEDCAIYTSVEKYGKASHATDNNIGPHMCFACWIIKATKAHSEYVMLIAIAWQ
jgi:hypothetical protein